MIQFQKLQVVKMKLSEEKFQLNFFKNLFMKLIEDYIKEREGGKIPLKDKEVFKNELERISEKISLIFINEFKQNEERMNKILSDEFLLKEWILKRINELELEENKK